MWTPAFLLLPALMCALGGGFFGACLVADVQMKIANRDSLLKNGVACLLFWGGWAVSVLGVVL